MVTVGVFVRAERTELALVAARLESLEGVSTLELEEPGTIGALIQASDLDAAHAKLCDEIRALEGVLVALPIHTELEPYGRPGGSAAASTTDRQQPLTAKEGKLR